MTETEHVLLISRPNGSRVYFPLPNPTDPTLLAVWIKAKQPLIPLDATWEVLERTIATHFSDDVIRREHKHAHMTRRRAS